MRDSQLSKVVPSIVEDSESIQPDIVDQSLNPDELAMAISRHTVQPTGEVVKRADATLHKLHCNSRHCLDRTLADRTEA